MSGARAEAVLLAPGGVPIARAFAALRRLEPHAHAFYLYDLDALEARARRFRGAFSPTAVRIAYALKANALPEVLETIRGAGLGAEAGSLGELELASAAGFPSGARVLNGNGRTDEEAEWAARHGVHSVNADHVGELDLLQRAAAAHGKIRVALRVNPGIDAPTHHYVATGDETAKFGMDPADALEVRRTAKRWPSLVIDGLHVHLGSQILDPAACERAAEAALELRREMSHSAPVGFVNFGGGFGVDYAGEGADFPVERFATWLEDRTKDLRVECLLEPGRWIVAPIGMLVAEVLAVKRRGIRRFVVLGAGMNDLLRPALYGARHRIVPVAPRPGAREPATITGPVCESADVFAREVVMAPLEPGDLVAILDAGAYAATMASNYNGRGRLAELVAKGGRLRRVRAAETARDLLARRTDDELAP